MNKKIITMTAGKTFIMQSLAGLLLGIFLLISELVLRQMYQISELRNPISVVFTGYLIAIFYLNVKNRLLSLFIIFYIVSFFAIESFHLAYFGYWISAINLWLMVEKANEVLIVGKSMMTHMLVPFILTAILMVIFVILFRLRCTKKGQIWIFDLIVILAFLYLPVQSSIRQNKDVVGKIPRNEHSILKSAYYTTNYFLSRTLPQEVLGWSTVPTYTFPAPNKINQGKADNLIIVMGESLSSQYVSAFGFQSDTTPWLKQQNGSSALIKPAYSAGLFTDVTLPFFFNTIQRPNAVKQIASGETNLFKQAKENGYKTYFFSTQPSTGLNLVAQVGAEWIDHYIDSYSITKNIDVGLDDKYLNQWLAEIDFSGKNFIVLNHNGSHEPYSEYIDTSDKHFGSNNFYTSYLSSVYYTDQNLKQIRTLVGEKAGKNWLLLYTSDHGQHVTETTMGKGAFQYESNYLVPAYIDSNNRELSVLYKTKFDRCARIFHFQLSTLISVALGYDTVIADCQSGYVSGGRLTGDSGYMSVTLENGKYVEVVH